jgi:LacI family sucrose operon transcriptional repressor
MQKPGLKDVALRSGVSVTTVSRVLNDRGYLSEETKKKVHTAMEELNYFPNEVARSLLGKKTKLIGLLFPNVTNPFYGEMVTELEGILSAKGYKALLCCTNDNIEKETSYLKMLLANQVDGIIVGSRNRPGDIYQNANLAIVAIDRIISEKVPIVRSDNYGGACMATEHLIAKECKDIALLTGSTEDEIAGGDLRMQGYLDTLKAHRRTPKMCRIWFEANEDVQKKEITRYLRSNPQTDGFFATGDMLAGMLATCAAQQNRQIEIVGYDGTASFRGLRGDTSTIQQPISEMACVAVDVLLKSIAGNYPEHGKEFVLPVELIVGKP